MSFGIEIEFEYSRAGEHLGAISTSLAPWAVVADDQSLRGEGGEIITNQLTYSQAAEFLAAVDNTFMAALGVSRTDTASQNSAVHVHFSLNHDRNWHRTPSLVVSQIIAGVVVEDILLSLHPSRFGGNFCVPETVSKIGYLLATIIPTLPDRRAVASFIRENAEKYSAVNFLPMATTSREVANLEYRMFPSTISTDQLLLAMSIMYGVHYAFFGQNGFFYSNVLRSLANIENPMNLISLDALIVGVTGEHPDAGLTQRQFNQYLDQYYQLSHSHRELVRFLSRIYLCLFDAQCMLPASQHIPLLTLIVEHVARQANDPNFRARMWAMRA